ncbi:hypothetical protein [Flavobacterium sp. 3HN19-14]|uniref:hypothetical protein n=1 Tax=Flavobacterium sp. 3HN19-14 TaxID=3448133 RepID=UPI003EDF3D55
MLVDRIKANRENIIYGISIALLIALIKWMEFRFVVISNRLEIYVGIIALIFAALGGWLVYSLLPKGGKPEIPVTEVPFIFNEAEAKIRNISKRELEVLALMETGLSTRKLPTSFLFLSTQ